MEPPGLALPRPCRPSPSGHRNVGAGSNEVCVGGLLASSDWSCDEVVSLTQRRAHPTGSVAQPEAFLMEDRGSSHTTVLSAVPKYSSSSSPTCADVMVAS
ncbi:hypothetical protein LIA77_01170 [Sarocladium implicatum]|nr:hypothetical protein LIA77_01170 [Sarocladium implicatum]